MSIGACLTDLEQQGVLDAERAAEARALYQELLADHARTGSRETAEALASEDLLAALERSVTRKEFLAGRAIKVRNRIAADLPGYRSAGGLGGRKGGDGGPIDPRAGPALLDRDPRARYSNVEARRKAIVSQAHRQLDKLMADHNANLIGKVRNKAQLRDITRELFGEASGNADAAAMASGWRRTAEMLRQRFNAAGGDIGFRSDWGLPQNHSWKRIRAAGFEAWKRSITPRLDLGRMIDTRTGKPITEARLDELLPAIFDDIRSQGAASRSPGSTPKLKALANRHADARFFVFRSADAWAEYSAEFGNGSAYDAMMAHIEGMARDTAALEVLGPNPTATLTWLKDTITASAQVDRDPGTKAVGRAKSAGRKIDRLWDEYRGAHLQPDNETLALVFSGYRAFATSTKLGSAFLSAASDFGFQASARAFNGLSRRTMLTDYIKMFRPGSIADQKMAVRRGLIAEEWAGRTAAQSRYLLEELSSEWTRRLAEGVLRVSLLSRHTQAMRWVYGMETLASYTEATGKAFGALDPKLRGALDRYGIGAEDWDKLRAAPMDSDGGVEWISPHNLDDQELASRFMEMVHSETDIAVPVSDLATRATINSKLERGTVVGELGRSMFQFKGFGVSVMLSQWQRMMTLHGGSLTKYAIGLALGTGITGGIALQMKALAAGQDPRPMLDGDFYKAAMLQGGGFGIFGDLLFADQTRVGGGFAQTLAGPMVDDLQGIANVVTAKDPRNALVREAKGFIPGNNLWYSRLALDRMVADQINQMINPAYGRGYRNQQRWAAEQGTSFWWRPGQGLPARSPDFANALEEGPPE